MLNRYPKHVKLDTEPNYGASAMKPKIESSTSENELEILKLRVHTLEQQYKQLISILGGN